MADVGCLPNLCIVCVQVKPELRNCWSQAPNHIWTLQDETSCAVRREVEEVFEVVKSREGLTFGPPEQIRLLPLYAALMRGFSDDYLSSHSLTYY